MRAPTPDLLTTSQAATLLQVHESSVKRWSNQGDLTSQKTAGGHRRIGYEALFEFARSKGIPADILALSPHEEEIAAAMLAAREKNDFAGLQEVVLKFCDVQPSRDLGRLLLLAENGMQIPRSRLYDEAVGGALREVGRQWQTGSRTIALEHRFTQKIVDALYARIQFQEALKYGPSPSSPGKAIVSCAEGCFHEIGGLMSRIALQSLGFEVTYLGANTPFEEIAGIQDMERAQIVCLSFVPPLNASDVKRSLKVLGALYANHHPYHLILGGAGTEMGWSEAASGPFLSVKVVTSMVGFELWLSQLSTLGIPSNEGGPRPAATRG